MLSVGSSPSSKVQKMNLNKIRFLTFFFAFYAAVISTQASMDPSFSTPLRPTVPDADAASDRMDSRRSSLRAVEVLGREEFNINPEDGRLLECFVTRLSSAAAVERELTDLRTQSARSIKFMDTILPLFSESTTDEGAFAMLRYCRAVSKGESEDALAALEEQMATSLDLTIPSHFTKQFRAEAREGYPKLLEHLKLMGLRTMPGDQNATTGYTRARTEGYRMEGSHRDQIRAILSPPVAVDGAEGSRTAVDSISRPLAPAMFDVARGHEAVYARFMNGKLIYRPTPGSDVGKREIRFVDVVNPATLEGTFDLSECDDAGTYLSINTGYRKGKIAANEGKVEVWIVPHFLVEKDIGTTAKHYATIMGEWTTRAAAAPVGLFWTWCYWADMSYYQYLTNQSFDALSDDHVIGGRPHIRSNPAEINPEWYTWALHSNRHGVASEAINKIYLNFN